MSAIPAAVAPATVEARGGRGALVAILVVAVLARVIPAILAPPFIAWSDGREYEAVALSLLSHHGYGLEAIRPPGYPTFMAAVWSITGHDLTALRIVEAVCGAIAVLAIARVGMKHFGRRVGLIAGGLAAIHPVLAYLPSTQYSENTLVLILVGAYATLLAALAPGERRTRLWVLAGVLLGLAMLWRPNVLLFVPGLVLGAAWLLARQRRPFVVPLTCLLLSALALVAPWIVRCHQVHGRWYFIATGGGRALWLGSNPQIAHGPYRLTFPDSTTLQRWSVARPPFDYDAAMGRDGFAYAKAHPIGAVVLYGRKLGSLYALWPSTYTRTPYINRSSQFAQGAVTLVVYAGLLLGLPWLRRTPALWPLVAGVVTFSLFTSIFFCVMRYRMPVEPVLLWISGMGWATVPFLRRTRID